MAEYKMSAYEIETETGLKHVHLSRLRRGPKSRGSIETAMTIVRQAAERRSLQ
ncbi:MAG: hypothetical protein HY678_10900 [Chloroflexi bacterium]|nr:hypothetical protein [Chloroflexota bacterium]